MTHEIKLTQSPIISHQIAKVGKEVTERINALDLDNLVATDQTIKTLKSTRAELNSELKEFEGQRKSIKTAILNPYAEMESLYKIEISGKYTEAVSKLGDKISMFENKVKDAKKEELIAYFDEICLSLEIDFLQWSNLNIDVNLSTTLKKYKEQIAEFVEKTRDDINLINSMEDKIDILVEYKKDLNSSRAITEVNTRKANAKAEKEKAFKERATGRRAYLFNIGMIPDDMTGAIAFDDDIYILDADVVNLEDPEYSEKVDEITKQISLKQSDKAEPIKAPTTAKTVPVKEPEQDPKVENVDAIIKVTAPMAVLKALGVYMKDQGIKYENYKPNN